MKAKKLINIAIAIVALFVLLYISLGFILSADTGNIVGQLNTKIVEKIEIITPDEKVVINNIDKINAILSCFDKDVTVITHFYDWLATGGCAGYHWDKAFVIKLIGNGCETELDFSDCDAPHQHEIKKDFIIWKANSISQLLYTSTGCRYLLQGYDLQSLSDNITKHINVKCVY